AGGDAPISHSIVQMNISAALCVPLMLGPAPAAYLYLDARSNRAAFAPTMRPHAAAFCGALGRLAGLALANLKRVDVERRQAMIAANAFVSPRRPDSRFVTLWIAVLDPTARTLTYVDAGHSYAALFEGSGASTELSAGGGPPLGVSDDFQYSVETVPLPPHG